MFTTVLGRLAAGENLTQEEMTAVMDAVIEGHVMEGQIAVLLTALAIKGETALEIAGAARSLRKHMTPIRTRHAVVVDTCGTGGVSSTFFNISTAAALVTAAAGVPVAKHGNRAVTSRTGSADVLAALGVNISADISCVERCLDELGICFCFAPLTHPSMKRVAEVRKRLGRPTIFNLLGPLCNPARPPFQLLGVGRVDMQPVMAKALALLGTMRSVTVCGQDNLGEVTIAGSTKAIEVLQDGTLVEHRWNAATFGLSEAESLDELIVKDAQESANIIDRVLTGKSGPSRDIVVANAAVAIWIAGKAKTLREGALAAQLAIDSGSGKQLLDELVSPDEFKVMNEHFGHDHHGHTPSPAATAATAGRVRDPVCGMMVDPAKAPAKFDYQGQTYYFCNPSCLMKFQANPDTYLAAVPVASGPQLAVIQPAKAKDTSRMTQPVQISGLRPLTSDPSGTTWVCPMDPEVRQEGPGSCPKCGMALEPEHPIAPPDAHRVDLPDAPGNCARRAGELPDLRDGAGTANVTADEEPIQNLSICRGGSGLALMLSVLRF